MKKENQAFETGRVIGQFVNKKGRQDLFQLFLMGVLILVMIAAVVACPWLLLLLLFLGK
jgi:hypothetical protein